MTFFDTLQRAFSEYLMVLLIYLVLVNAVTFTVYYLDKRKAINKKWRIPEHDLILLAIFGGSVGALLAMKIFRHKTRHAKFYIGIPVILIIQLILAILIIIT